MCKEKYLVLNSFTFKNGKREREKWKDRYTRYQTHQYQCYLFPKPPGRETGCPCTDSWGDSTVQHFQNIKTKQTKNTNKNTFGCIFLVEQDSIKWPLTSVAGRRASVPVAAAAEPAGGSHRSSGCSSPRCAAAPRPVASPPLGLAGTEGSPRLATHTHTHALSGEESIQCLFTEQQHKTWSAQLCGYAVELTQSQRTPDKHHI